MRVSLERGAGFVGPRATSSMDTDDLAPDEAAAAMRVLDDLLVAPAAAPSAPTPRPRYRLSVARPAGDQVVELTEPDVPPALRPLLAALARRTPPTP